MTYSFVLHQILFGSKYDSKKYDRVLRACDLADDLASMADGDRTEIGER